MFFIWPWRIPLPPLVCFIGPNFASKEFGELSCEDFWRTLRTSVDAALKQIDMLCKLNTDKGPIRRIIWLVKRHFLSHQNACKTLRTLRTNSGFKKTKTRKKKSQEAYLLWRHGYFSSEKKHSGSHHCDRHQEWRKNWTDFVEGKTF